MSINLLLVQRIFKRYAELVKLLRELGGVNIAHTEVVNHIDHGNRPFSKTSYFRTNGILNILDRYSEIFGNAPDYVITGFHMMKKDGKHTEDEKTVIMQTAQELSQMNTVFYSGHCTGIPAFELMKDIMGDQLIALHSGEQIF